MAGAAARAGADVPVDLCVNFAEGPLAVPPSAVRFSWRTDSERTGAAQTAYRLQVARSRSALAAGRPDVWDSGKVPARTATDVAYDGPALEAGTEYCWSVRCWDERDRPSAWAAVASFETSLAGEHEWVGEWIGHRPGVGDANGYRSRWSPETATDEEWVTVDLGDSREITQIELVPTEPFDGPTTPDGLPVSALYSHAQEPSATGAAGFGFPRRYRIDLAHDEAFDTGRTVVDRTDQAQPNPGSDLVSHELDETGRYVRITATERYRVDPFDPPLRERGAYKEDLIRDRHDSWQVFALGGLAIRDAAGTDLAAGCQVSARSSVEDETWSRSYLTAGDGGTQRAPGAALLRTEFDAPAAVVRARAYVCGLGYGELSLNGERVGQAVLDPAWTTYDERVCYRTYDVTDHVDAGGNAIGLWLGRGWFDANRQGWTGFGAPRGIVMLELDFADGTTQRIGTDGSWRATAGPIVENDIYDGEVYDARREQDGWTRPRYDDSHWDCASVVSGPGGELVPQRTPPIRVTETLEPVEIIDRSDGPIVDFGQNLVGWVAVTIDGATAGEAIELEHAETLTPDGELAMADLRTAEATDTYRARGDPLERYEPRFTYHGFRYVKVRGYPGKLEPGDITAKAVHTDLDPIGEFECSDEAISQLQENARWGLRGNIHGVLTDCPQRDERFGWTGDNHIASRALCYNFQSARFYRKWLADHADVRSDHGYLADTVPFGYGSIPEDRTWGITQVTIPWHLYRHYGDVRVLERHYEGMCRYIEYWHEESTDGYLAARTANYGDWLAFERTDGRRGLPYDLFATAYHYHTTSLLGRIAEILGRTADAERFSGWADATAETFQDRFYDPGTGTYGPGTQSSYAVPLYVGLVPDDRTEKVAANLAEKVKRDGGKLRTGFLGTRPLVHTLVDHGYEDLAYTVVTQRERPGWGYMVEQGATTMWERWDSDDRIGDGMNSFNHSPLTFISEWFYEALAGIRFDEDGVVIAPSFPDALAWVRGQVETETGSVRSRWERTAEGIVLSIEVPWNRTVTVRIPRGDETELLEDGTVLWDGQPPKSMPPGIEGVRTTGADILVEVRSGTYSFRLDR